MAFLLFREFLFFLICREYDRLSPSPIIPRTLISNRRPTRHRRSCRFLIGKAAERCNNEVNKYIDVSVQGDIPDLEELKSILKMHIRGAVANNDGYEYEGYYPLEGQDMMFGAQSIDVKDGVE